MEQLLSKQKVRGRVSLRKNHSFQGTIMIPDISGFSKFVSDTELNIGREITKELLTSIIENNILGLHLSEIEGDAALFYSQDLFSPEHIKKQYEVWLNKFRRKIKKLNMRLKTNINLSLKLIVHSGKISTYTIGEFEKLYGKTVIEAHSLLKNTIKSKTYILMTKNVFRPNRTETSNSCYFGSQLCEVDGRMEDMDYHYFDYDIEELSDILVPIKTSNGINGSLTLNI